MHEKEIINEGFSHLRHPNPRGTKKCHQNHKSRQTSKYIIVQFAKYRHNENFVKAAREKKSASYKGRWMRLAQDLSIETGLTRSSGIVHSTSWMGKKYAAKYTLSTKTVDHNIRRDNDLPRQKKKNMKGVGDH